MVVRAELSATRSSTRTATTTTDQAWRLLTYNWTDINGDGRLWRDRDGDGVVDHVRSATSSNIDGNPDIDFAPVGDRQGRVRPLHVPPAGSQRAAVVRARPGGSAMARRHVPRPAAPARERGDPGHRLQGPDRLLRERRLAVADHAGVGQRLVHGARRRAGRTRRTACTTARSCSTQRRRLDRRAGRGRRRRDGRAGRRRHRSRRHRRSAARASPQAQANLLYNNGSVFGAHDWTWRAESGDWRFFFLDVPKAPPQGTLFLRRHDVGRPAPYTDLDTLDLRAVGEHVPAARRRAPFGAPYILDTVGGSENTNIGAGVWQFDTATGGDAEIVTAPAQEGLHAFVQHQVGWQGGKFHVPFEVTVGAASVNPSAVDADDRGRQRQRSTSRSSRASTSTASWPRASASASRATTTETVAAGRPERPDHGERQAGRHDRATRRGDASRASCDRRHRPVRRATTPTGTARSRPARSSRRRRPAPATSASS